MGNYYVFSDGVELTPRQYAGVRALLARRVLESERIQATRDTDLQAAIEEEIVESTANYGNFRRDRAIVSRGPDQQRWQGEYAGTQQLLVSERTIAAGVLDRLFAPDKFRQYRLTPDGFVR